MGRMTDDGRHEGVVQHIFADGMAGSGWGHGGATVTDRPDGTSLEVADWQTRPDDEVVAWQAICTDCSTHRYPRCWSGPIWTRVATPAEQDPDQRRIYSTDSLLPDDVDLLLMRDWERHIAPYLAVLPVQDAAAAVSQAQSRLTDAARQARAEGASWENIGAAAGISESKARDRWS